MTWASRRQPGPVKQEEGMIEDTGALSKLVARIYDAAFDQALWAGVLTDAFEFVGGCGAALFSKDAVSQQGSVYYAVGIQPYYRQLYFDKYIALDPSTTGQFFAEIDQPIATADLMPYDEFLETQFYQEWVRPQGFVDFVSAMLDKSSTSGSMFGVFRHERNGVVDDETRRRMRLIVPHVRRAVLVGRMFDFNAAEAATFADTLDGLSAGICLVDAAGRIVHANVAARAMIATGEVLHSLDGRLTASDSLVDQSLRDIFAAAGQGDAALGTKGIAVPLSAPPAEPWLAHILPLTSGARRDAGIAYSAVAAVFVSKALFEVPSSLETISKRYKLTPSELRVLAAVSDAGGIPSLATALGVSAATVKTHLHHLFNKTGTNSQADLVKLLAAHASPLRT